MYFLKEIVHFNQKHPLLYKYLKLSLNIDCTNIKTDEYYLFLQRMAYGLKNSG